MLEYCMECKKGNHPILFDGTRTRNEKKKILICYEISQLHQTQFPLNILFRKC